jgi:transcription elongation factor GreB
MSKAFTRESDELPEQPILSRQPVSLTAGAKNYLTPDGARRLREELARLVEVERPRLAAAPEDAEAKRQRLVLDQRIRHLQQVLFSAIVLPRPVPPEDRVRFGATVTVREGSGGEARYRIVGAAEADPGRGWVSWLSPLAKALLNARVGERVRLKLPASEAELEIVGIQYE